jgi:MFS superfamily sulfate permease-like transporter
MLALLAVLLLASIAGFVELLPLFAVAAVLFVVAAVLVWRWAITEAELAAPRSKADQVSEDEGRY